MKITKLKLFILCIFVLFPKTSFAIQAHGGSEGIIVHQGGHLFFLLSLCALVYWLEKKWFLKGKSRRYFQLFGLFLILWNLDVILMHFLDEQIEIIDISRSGLDVMINSSSNSQILKYIYYLGKMDHILCVPALIFLYMALNSIENESEKGEG